MLCTMEAFTSPSAILRRAKDHISKPEMWYKGGFSKNGIDGAIEGLPCCAEGADMWARQSWHGGAELCLLDKASRRERGQIVAAFNDAPETTHADILSVFDRAIALADADAVQRIRERV